MPASSRTDATDSRAAFDVRALYFNLLTRWNEQDAAGFAAHFAADGHVVGFDGSLMNGPAEIEATLGSIFESHPTARYVAKVRGITMLGSDVALLQALAGMVPPGDTDLNPAVNAIQSLVARRDTGHWRIALFQNTPATFHGRPELVARMTEELREVLRGE